MSGPAARLIERALLDAAGERLAPAARPIAVGWATVELDRAAAELTQELGLPPDAFLPAADCDALGASCRVAVDGWAAGTAIAILEPATEGRLAEFLARFGEGPAAIWFTTPSPAVTVGPTRPGPFGPERVALDDPAERVYRFLVATEPGTIGR